MKGTSDNSQSGAQAVMRGALNKTVAIFSAQFHPSVGGVEQYTLQLGKELQRRAYRVIIVTSAQPGFNSHDSYEGLEVLRIPTRQLAKGRLPVALRNAKTGQLLAWLASQAPDYVVVQGHLYELAVMGARFGKKQSIPTLVIEHSSGHVLVGNPLLDRGMRFYEHLMAARIRKTDPSFVSVSRRGSAWSAHFGISSKGELYNSVDPAAILEEAQACERDFRLEFEVGQGDVMVVCAGRLVRGKGTLELIEALRYARETHPELRLFIAGDGDLLPAVRSRASQDVVVLGRLSHPELMRLMRQADIFCLPSRLPEGLPTVLLEAIANRCFCIVSDTGGSSELISDKTSGLLLSATDPLSIAQALTFAAQNRNRLSDFTQAAYEVLLHDYTWEETTTRLLEHFTLLDRTSIESR